MSLPVIINGSWEKEKAEFQDRLRAIHLPRTNFELRNFVLGMHGDKCPKVYYQLLREATVCNYELHRMLLELKEVERDIEQWTKRLDQDPEKVVDQNGNVKFIYADIQIKKCQSRKLQLEDEIVGKKRMHDRNVAALKDFPEVWTAEDMENDEPEYWGGDVQGRIGRFEWQNSDAFLSARTGLDRGDIRSIEQCSRTGYGEDIRKLPPIRLNDQAVKSLLWQVLPPEVRAMLLSDPNTAGVFDGIPETQGLIGNELKE
jgi:hypothetical protein